MPVMGPVKCRLVSARLTPRGGVTLVGQLFLSGLRLFTRRRRGLANELPYSSVLMDLPLPAEGHLCPPKFWPRGLAT